MGILSRIGTFLAGPAGAVAGGVAQGIINAGQNRANIDRQNKANRELAQYQYSKDLEMWNRGNTYNAPEAQMDRLKKAGLNPNLVYGSGAVAGQSAQQLPKYSTPQQDFSYQPPVDLPKNLGQYQDMRIQNAQLDNLKAQRNAIQMDTLIKAAEAEWRPTLLNYKAKRANYDAAYSHNRNDILAETMGHQIDFIKGKNRVQENMLQQQIATIARMSAQTELTKLQRDMFLPSFWAKTLTGGFNAVKGLFKTGAKAVPKGTPAPRVTPRSSPAWRQKPVGKRIRYVR